MIERPCFANYDWVQQRKAKGLPPPKHTYYRDSIDRCGTVFCSRLESKTVEQAWRSCSDGAKSPHMKKRREVEGERAADS